jgi:PIN domain
MNRFRRKVGPMRVVIDTNTFYSDLGMRGLLRVLLDAARRGEITLVVPEVVVQEVLKRFRVRYLDESRRRSASSRILADLGFEGAEGPRLPDVAEALITYEAFLRGRLHDVGALVPFVPNAGHDEILQRAIERRKPFKENGAGYQDTLIWLNVLDEADAGEVALITKNTADFGERVGEAWSLAPDLQQDLVGRGLDPAVVTLYNEVREFIGDDLGAEEEDLTGLRAQLIEDDAIREFLEREIEEDLAREPIRLADEILRNAEVEAARVVGSTIEEIDVVDAYEFEEEDELYVVLRARVNAEVEFDLDRREVENLGHDERRLLLVWGEGVVTGRRRATLEVDAEAVLDQDGELQDYLGVTSALLTGDR